MTNFLKTNVGIAHWGTGFSILLEAPLAIVYIAVRWMLVFTIACLGSVAYIAARALFIVALRKYRNRVALRKYRKRQAMKAGAV